MIPCSSDLVPSINLKREGGERRKLADAAVERADLEKTKRGVVDVEREREIAGKEVELGLLAAMSEEGRRRRNSYWKKVESTPWNVTMISRISTFSGIFVGEERGEEGTESFSMELEGAGTEDGVEPRRADD